MMLSDFSPAFTTTKLSSTLTTSAVMTSPMRISLRVRLSSNRAAKESPAGWVEAGERLAMYEKTFSFRTVSCAGYVENRTRKLLSSTNCLIRLQNPFDYRLDREARRIEHLRVRRRNQGSDRAISVARIPLLQITGKGAQISIDSFFYQLLIAALGPYFRGGCQENLQRRIRENHGSHVAAVGDQAGRLAEGPLPLQEHLAHLRHARHFGGPVADVLAADVVCNIMII